MWSELIEKTAFKQQELSNLQTRLDQIKCQNESIACETHQEENRKDELKSKIAALNQQKKELTEDIQSMKAKLEKESNRSDHMKITIDTLTQKRDEIKSLIQEMELSNTTSIKDISNQIQFSTARNSLGVDSTKGIE